MKITNANRQIWLDFFKSAQAFRDMKSWEWMLDQDMFGVQDPVTGEIGYCCIMGAAGEVFALGVYYGEEGYLSFLKLFDLDEALEIDRMAAGIEQKILKVEFVGRDEIDKTDRETFKKLGLKFRGHCQWIQAREMLPAYFPTYLSDEQAVYLTHVFWQAMEVAERFRKDESILENEEEKTLVRVPRKTAEGLVWEDQYFFEPDEENKPLKKIDPKLVSKAKKELKREKAAICFSLHYMPGVIEKGEGEDRPFFAKMAMWIAYGSAFILGFELFSPRQYEKGFDQHFFDKLHAIGMIPQQIVVNSEMAAEAMQPFADALDIELILTPELEDFQEVFESMGQMMGGGFG